MNKHTHWVSAGLATVAVMLLLSSARAGAQPITWNPPCGVMTVNNASGCPVEFNLWSNLLLTLVTIPPGMSVSFATPVGTVINGIISQAGTPVGNVSPGPIPPPPAPPVATTGWVRGIVQGPAKGCCVDYHFDLPTCTIWIFNGTAPCTP